MIIPIYNYKKKIVMQYSDKYVKITPLFDRLGKEVNKDAQYSVVVDIVVDGGFPRFYYNETSVELLPEEIEEITAMVNEFAQKK